MEWRPPPFHTQYAEMADGAVNYLGMPITEGVSEAGPSVSGVE